MVLLGAVCSSRNPLMLHLSKPHCCQYFASSVIPHYPYHTHLDTETMCVWTSHQMLPGRHQLLYLEL